MTLQQIFDWCNRKSYYSRDASEIWQAINSAAHLLYKEVVLENSGYFLVFDTTSLTLLNAQEEYQLPAAVQQIVRLREQLPGETCWRVIYPAGLNDVATTAANYGFDTDVGVDGSPFIYNGPYLKQTDAAAQDATNSIRIEPIPTETHNTELVYTADFLEITGQASKLVIDAEGHDAMKYLATAELLVSNDDDNFENFTAMGNYHKTQYLKLVRKRQTQRGPVVEPYLTDLD